MATSIRVEGKISNPNSTYVLRHKRKGYLQLVETTAGTYFNWLEHPSQATKFRGGERTDAMVRTSNAVTLEEIAVPLTNNKEG